LAGSHALSIRQHSAWNPRLAAEGSNSFATETNRENDEKIVDALNPHIAEAMGERSQHNAGFRDIDDSFVESLFSSGSRMEGIARRLEIE
jgi:hypothetical protein